MDTSCTERSATAERTRCRILEHSLPDRQVTPVVGRLVFDAPGIARKCIPGQFVHVLCGDTYDPLLRRPFSIHDADPSSGHVSIVYEVRGRGTDILVRKAVGETLDVLGPLGNGFALPQDSSRPVLIVGGGIGAAPLYFLANSVSRTAQPNCLNLLIGARTASGHVCFEAFEDISQRTHTQYQCCTDDGSLGLHGLVTDPLTGWLDALSGDHRPIVYACGPTPMLKAVSGIARERDLDCQVSVEAKMACGLGACMGCVIEVRVADSGTRYVRSCVEGPVFDAKEIVWG